jgi:hypothetical protein
MVSSIDMTMNLDCMDTHVHIGSTIFLTGRSLLDIVSVLAPVWSRGAVEIIHVWHSV